MIHENMIVAVRAQSGRAAAKGGRMTRLVR